MAVVLPPRARSAWGGGPCEAWWRGDMAPRKKITRRNSAVNRARQLRREPSPPEYRLWQALRLRPAGLKFRRQHPFDRCTVDFFCPSARLVVEVDGDSHSMGDNPERDARRDAWLRSQGVEVLRFDARDVMNDV